MRPGNRPLTPYATPLQKSDIRFYEFIIAEHRIPPDTQVHSLYQKLMNILGYSRFSLMEKFNGMT